MFVIRGTIDSIKNAGRSGLFWLFVFILMTNLFVTGQDLDEGKIRWISMFPDPDIKNNKNLGERITDLILGEKGFAVSKPMSVLANSPQDYWILDQELGTLVHVKNGKGKAVMIPKGMQPFPSLVSMCSFSEGRILFTDSRLDQVYIYNPGNDKFIPFCKSGLLDQPTGIAWLEDKKEVWITETRQHRITIMNPRGRIIRFLGKRGTNPGEFNFPTDIIKGKEGKILIIDAMNHRIQIFNQDGKYISSFGQAGDATGYFARPKGLAMDSGGNIYVTDALFHVVQIFNNNGGFLYYFGKQGRDRGRFWMPSGIYIDENDYIYIADTYNARVQVFQLSK